MRGQLGEEQRDWRDKVPKRLVSIKYGSSPVVLDDPGANGERTVHGAYGPHRHRRLFLADLYAGHHRPSTPPTEPPTLYAYQPFPFRLLSKAAIQPSDWRWVTSVTSLLGGLGHKPAHRDSPCRNRGLSVVISKALSRGEPCVTRGERSRWGKLEGDRMAVCPSASILPCVFAIGP